MDDVLIYVFQGINISNIFSLVLFTFLARNFVLNKTLWLLGEVLFISRHHQPTTSLCVVLFKLFFLKQFP